MKPLKVGDVFYVLHSSENEYFGDCIDVRAPTTLKIIEDCGEVWRVKAEDNPYIRYFNKRRAEGGRFAFATLEEAWERLEHELHVSLNDLGSRFESYRNSVNKLLKEKNVQN